jgi:hypothetical protein
VHRNHSTTQSRSARYGVSDAHSSPKSDARKLRELRIGIGRPGEKCRGEHAEVEDGCAV